jgi:DNA mismatch repair ATPase MutL
LWQQPLVVRQLGLLHSVYGNAHVDLVKFDPKSERGRLQEAVGEDAERLIHLFCVMSRTELVRELFKGNLKQDGSLTITLNGAPFDLPPRELEAVRENLRVLEESGFGVEVFGGRSLKVEALPDFLSGRDPRRVMEDFAAECLSGGATRVRGAWAEDAVRRAVVRLGTGEDAAFDEAAQRLLVEQLLGCELPYCDAEGRPVMLQFSWRELDRKFGRS